MKGLLGSFLNSAPIRLLIQNKAYRAAAALRIFCDMPMYSREAGLMVAEENSLRSALSGMPYNPHSA